MLLSIPKSVVAGSSLLLIGGVVVYLFMNFFYYLDLPGGCVIKLNTATVGSSTAMIKQSLAYLQENDMVSYQRVCRSVDTITERSCITADWLTSPDDFAVRQSACYIKGSKTVYLAPVARVTADIVQQKAASLKLVSLRSEEYWRDN